MELVEEKDHQTALHCKESTETYLQGKFTSVSQVGIFFYRHYSLDNIVLFYGNLSNFTSI